MTLRQRPAGLATRGREVCGLSGDKGIGALLDQCRYQPSVYLRS
jgi:hypothetical protein